MRTGAARILFVSGKGGTGKSFVAEALAGEAASRGFAVALVRVSAPAAAEPEPRPPSAGAAVTAPLRTRRAARAAEVGPKTEAAASAPALDSDRRAPAFQQVTLDERATLEKFLTRVLRLGFVARRLLDSRTFSAVAAAAPGLRDLVTLTAITTLAAARRQGFDLIVVDAPASGHSVALLRSPQQVLDIAAVGPVAHEARLARALIADADRFLPLIVTTPEELAITEALSLHGNLLGAGAGAARIVVNGLWPGHLSPQHADWLLGSAASTDALLHYKRRRRQLELVAGIEQRIGRCPTLPFTFEEGKVPRAAVAALLDTLLGTQR